jgi:LTXXQ motif family protein
MKKIVLIGGIAAAAILAGGWAVAQSPGYGPGYGPRHMQGGGPYGMGPGMMWDGQRGMGSGYGQDGGRGWGPGMHHMGRAMMGGGPGWGFLDSGRLDAIKRELAITPAQDAAWSKYAKAVEDATSGLRTLHDGVDRESVSKMSPTERQAVFAKLHDQRWQQHGNVRTAASELFAALDDRQKERAEDVLPGLGGFGPGAGFGPGGGPGMMHGGRMGGWSGWR